MTIKWKESEERNWLDSVSGYSLFLVLWGFAFRVYALYFVGHLSNERLAAFTALFAVCAAVHQASARTRSESLKKFGCYLYLELLQACLHLIVLYADPNYCSYYVVMGTILCLTHHINLLMDSWLVVLIMSKHVITWMVVPMYAEEQRQRPFFPYMTFFVMIVMTLKVSRYRQNVARERMEFCESLIQQERRVHTIMEAFPDGLLVLTANLSIKTLNQELLSLLAAPYNCNLEETVKAQLKGLKYEREVATGADEGKELWRDAVGIAEGSIPPSTLGTTLVVGRYLEWKGSFSTWDQEPVCILTVRDSTNWIQMQENIRRESASKTALLRSVSHELRTPTNAIINLIRETLEAATLPQNILDDLGLVSICSQFLISIINDLLDYSKLIAGHFALTRVKFTLRPVLQQTVSLFKPQCKAKHLEFNLNIDPLLPEEAFSDPNRLKQVLLNLLSNAVKFTMSGSIRVMALFTANGKLKVVVEDTGIGIAKSKQGKLFKLFGKLEGNEVLNPQGSGLGLNIANALALELGGKPIELQSEEGKGAAFSFYVEILEGASQSIPLIEGSGIGEVPEDVPPYIRVPQLLRSEHYCSRQQPLADILLVDDSDFNRLVIRRILQTMNYRVDEAATGLQALIQVRKAYSERGHLYKVVLMDLEMPEMDGLTAVREIQQLVTHGELPTAPSFIACSAYSSTEDKELCYAAGMLAYLEKPISKESLLTVVSSFL